MTDKQQIELQEIASIIVKTDWEYRGICWQDGVVKCSYGEPMNCQACLTAKNIIDANYRKVDENAVVLTREEYDSLNEEIKRYKDEREFIGKCMLKNTSKYVELTSDFTDMLDKIHEHACQETANMIFTKLIEVARNNDNKISIGVLKAWAIEYGVEVK